MAHLKKKKLDLQKGNLHSFPPPQLPAVPVSQYLMRRLLEEVCGALWSKFDMNSKRQENSVDRESRIQNLQFFTYGQRQSIQLLQPLLLPVLISLNGSIIWLVNTLLLLAHHIDAGAWSGTLCIKFQCTGCLFIISPQPQLAKCPSAFITGGLKVRH